MKLIAGKRVPLSEQEFTDTNAARFYDEHARRFMSSVYRRFAKKAARFALAGARVLDVGTGSGRLAIELARARPGWQVTGVDVSEDMLNIARQNAARSGLSRNINFRQAPAAALPFPDGYFSLVVSNASLHLWRDPVKVCGEIARVTAPVGYCLIRDNVRLSRLFPLLGLIGRTMGMNKMQRRLWTEAIRASYTPGEVKSIFHESPLKDARVSIAPDLLYLDIAWQKTR